MVTVGLLVRLVARAGKEKEMADFIKQALPAEAAEPGVLTWYAIRINASTFGIFDSFNDLSRKTHLGSDIANAIIQHSPELLAGDPEVEQVEVLETGSRMPGGS